MVLPFIVHFCVQTVFIWMSLFAFANKLFVRDAIPIRVCLAVHSVSII